MKTIFDSHHRNELIGRIRSLSTGNQARWGKMDVYQMLTHCILSEELYLEKTKYGRLFIGRLFGGMALKGILKDEMPMKKNLPTHPLFKISGSGDVLTQQEKWVALLNEYAGYNGKGLVHPFFGHMNRDQVGVYVYKHTDHHLRQFGA